MPHTHTLLATPGELCGTDRLCAADSGQEQAQSTRTHCKTAGAEEGRGSGSSTASKASGVSSANSLEQERQVQAAMQAHAHLLTMHPVSLQFQNKGAPSPPSLTQLAMS